MTAESHRTGSAAGVRAACLALAVLLGLGAAAARDLTGAERQALAQRVERFDASMRAKDAPQLVDIIPPRVLAAIAKQYGVTVEAARKATIGAMQEGFKSVEFESFGMSLPGAKDRTLPSGTPYLLIPTTVSIKLASQRISTNSDTLAMMDDGVWYLLDLSQAPQVAIFSQVYPEFQGADLGAKSTKAVP